MSRSGGRVPHHVEPCSGAAAVPVVAASALLALLLALSACSGPTGVRGSAGPEPSAGTDATAGVRAAGVEEYVALGDSFTAGPLVPVTDVADGCFRSTGNYPSLVAERLDVERFVDVSCSGADTGDLTSPQPTFGEARVPAQIEAVDRDTDLVSVGIGGNDFDLFATLVGSCAAPRPGRGARTRPCAERLSARAPELLARIDRIGHRVERALRRIRRRAPDSQVLLVGYPRLVPETGTCRALPLASDDYDLGRRVGAALNDALARAARRTDVGFVDLHRLSEGHDICSEDPWVNGRRTRRAEALAFHPFATGMSAAADAVVDAVAAGQGGGTR